MKRYWYYLEARFWILVSERMDKFCRDMAIRYPYDREYWLNLSGEYYETAWAWRKVLDLY